MENDMSKEKMKYGAPVLVCILLIAVLLLLPTGYEDAVQYQNAERCRAEVMAVDNSAIVDTGLVRSGEQRCTLVLTDGKFKGQTAVGINMLQGSLEQDKLFEVGDKTLVVVSHDGETITNVTMIDHYRISWELVMAAMFVVFLVLFAGKTGLRAIFSFALTVLAIWKLLVPLYLKGFNPIWIGLAVTLLLTTMIIALVYGFDRRCAAAVSGSFLGILVTAVLGIVFTDLFKIHGAVMAYSESLLYAGFQDLNLTQIFMASIFLGSSGAVMDLSVDITSAVHEVVEKKPDIKPWEAVKSGMNVGRAAMGTMTTTLLLAYSGGYIALLMVFMAQGTPVEHIFNYKYVAAEIIHTVIGSFGLVSVAPFTAMCAGLMLTRK
ncbi:MAG: YibE/F family protein [Oscillospiraceae bacterium]|nr:YibE/F family protein [Oscillospiraceae bacterium]